MDEIGLAELSDHNPLKVLHSALDKNDVAFIGLSNWSLDAAKMNRALHLNCPMLEEEDLIEIAERFLPLDINFSFDLAETIVRIYQKLMEEMDRYDEFAYFHGSRDYYYLLKSVSSHIKDELEKNRQSQIYFQPFGQIE